MLSWFKSWLSDRTQYTKFNETLSEPRSINDGIPQGTPLSCVFFNLYINLIVRCLRFCEIKLFADDCLVWIAADDVNNAVRKIGIDLENISKLVRRLRLKLNRTKTKYMVIGDSNSNNTYNIEIDGEIIERVNIMKYLGVKIDDKLNFKEHCEYIVAKMSKKVNFLRRIRNRLDLNSSLLLFNALIVPHVDFCSSILFMLNETQLRTIQLIQNRAMRIILNCPRDTSVERMHRQTSLLSVRQRIYYNVLLLMFKATKNLLPSYITSQLTYVADVQPYALRSNTCLRLPQLLTNKGHKSFLYRGSQLYNDMMRSGVDRNAKLSDFKTTLNEYVRNKF